MLLNRASWPGSRVVPPSNQLSWEDYFRCHAALTPSRFKGADGNQQKAELSLVWKSDVAGAKLQVWESTVLSSVAAALLTVAVVRENDARTADGSEDKEEDDLEDDHEDDLEDYTAEQLRQVCRDRGQPTSGNKSVLLSRIVQTQPEVEPEGRSSSLVVKIIDHQASFAQDVKTAFLQAHDWFTMSDEASQTDNQGANECGYIAIYIATCLSRNLAAPTYVPSRPTLQHFFFEHS